MSRRPALRTALVASAAATDDDGLVLWDLVPGVDAGSSEAALVRLMSEGVEVITSEGTE